MTHALKPACRLVLLSLCALMACIGPKKLFDATFADLLVGCEDFGEKVGATESCDMSASAAEEECLSLIEEAEEYDCKQDATNYIDCLTDADMSRVCDGKDVCTSAAGRLIECFGG